MHFRHSCSRVFKFQNIFPHYKLVHFSSPRAGEGGPKYTHARVPPYLAQMVGVGCIYQLLIRRGCISDICLQKCPHFSISFFTLKISTKIFFSTKGGQMQGPLNTPLVQIVQPTVYVCFQGLCLRTLHRAVPQEPHWGTFCTDPLCPPLPLNPGYVAGDIF